MHVVCCCIALPQVVWDPETQRPHIMLHYCHRKRSQPLQDLLLDYEWLSYW